MVTVLVPAALRPLTGGQDRVRLERSVSTVGQALEALWAIHPGLRLRVVTEQGAVRPHVNVFVGNESIRETGGLETPVGHGAEIAIIAAVSGGTGPGPSTIDP
jgi:molybdopterin converting factor small subunit